MGAVVAESVAAILVGLGVAVFFGVAVGAGVEVAVGKDVGVEVGIAVAVGAVVEVAVGGGVAVGADVGSAVGSAVAMLVTVGGNGVEFSQPANSPATMTATKIVSLTLVCMLILFSI